MIHIIDKQNKNYSAHFMMWLNSYTQLPLRQFPIIVDGKILRKFFIATYKVSVIECFEDGDLSTKYELWRIECEKGSQENTTNTNGSSPFSVISNQS